VEREKSDEEMSFPKKPDERILKESLFLKACRRERTDRAPLWLMRQAGRFMKFYRELRAKVSLRELCRRPDLSAEVTVEAVRRLGVDAAIIFSDLLLPVEPLGFRLEYTAGEGPRIHPPLRRASDLARLKNVDVEESLGYVAAAVRRARAALPSDVPLIGFSGAPFTLAAYLIEGGGSRDFVRTKSFMHEEPRAWHRLLRRLSRTAADLLNLQIRAGAQAVQVFDTWAGCLSPDHYRRFVLPHSRALFSRLDSSVPVIHFATNAGGFLEALLEAMPRENVRRPVIGLDWRVDIAQARRRLGRAAVMGNLDPAVLLSPRANIRREAEKVFASAGARPGYIFNLGHGVLPQTPEENVRYLVDVVKEISSGKRK